MSISARLTLLPGLVLAALALGALPSTSEAQFGKRLKDAVKRTAEDKAIQKATTEESKTIDGAMEGGGDAKPDTAAAGEAAPSTPTTAGAAATTNAPTPAASSAAPSDAAAPPKKAGEGAFVNFDFVPGDRVLFLEDYASDNVGDFPRRLEFAEGNAEIAEWEGGRWLRVSKTAKFSVVLPQALPERFTVEFDYVTSHKASRVADHGQHQRREGQLGEPGRV